MIVQLSTVEERKFGEMKKFQLKMLVGRYIIVKAQSICYQPYRYDSLCNKNENITDIIKKKKKRKRSKSEKINKYLLYAYASIDDQLL